MAGVLFFVFLTMDVFMILICRFAYGKRDEYTEGMILGVHIPFSEKENPEVQAISRKASKIWKKYHWIHLSVGSLICVICFLSFEIFMIIWLVWLLFYLVGLYYLLYVPHRQMYRLKMEKNWVNEATRHIVCIDTELAGMAEQMTVNWKWHLPVLTFFVISGLLLGWKRKNEMSECAGWILCGIFLGVSVLFFLIHLWIVGRRNMVYSQDTKINFTANQVIKRSLTLGILWANYLNGAGWLWLCLQLLAYGWISGTDYVIFLMLQTASAIAFVIPLLSVRKRKQQILEQDTSPVWVDDDEYWKNGWYSNPNDTHLLVPDRMCSTNYSFNMARPAAKVLVGFFVILILGVCIWTGRIMLQTRNPEISFQKEDSQVKIEAAGYECEFQLSQIQSLKLIEELPDEHFIRTNGVSTDKVAIGHYKGKETGKCMLFLNRECSPVLKIVLEDERTVYLNSNDSDEVKKWYKELKNSG